ncbi:protein tyrosine phosphatase [Kocuria sp. WRN011]|uniref:ABC transporter ATP-binding protein n=1 Tax=Kocuria TaxID=57493 RepID=UPI000BB03CD9|nr:MULTISPECIES: ABC transporter ATP-binding protein [Kocuria]PBB09680.1 protein tyrosine phosphatase [Kocuria sp. WRN011]
MSSKSKKAGKVDPGALRRTLKIVRPHLGGQKWLMSGGITALLFEVAFRVLEPWPTKFVVDAVTAQLGATIPGAPAATASLLVACAAAVVLIVGLRALSNYLATVCFALAGSRVATKLRASVFSHVQSLSDGYHATSKRGDLVQRLVGDVGKLQDVAVTAGLPLIANVITLLVMAVVMFVLDARLACVVVLAAIAYWVTSQGSTTRITEASRRTRKGEGQLANIAQESLGAIGVVHAYSLHGEISKNFSGSNMKTLKDGVQAKKLAAGLERRTDVIVGVATALVLGGGGWRVVQGGMSPGDLVIFLTYLKTAMKPLRDLAKYTGRIARATASGERIADVLDVPVDIGDDPNAKPLAYARGELALRDVWFGYNPGDPILRGVDVEIPAGQRVAVVGPSGAGKSTISKLLPRLIDPDQGKVCLDGTNIRDITLESLRSHIALVPQETVLFSGTINDNIRYGRLDATDEEVQEAARRAYAHDFICAMPEAYDTYVGERGGTLSGGQRQRIAVARALLRDSPVVVLDEATTGLDPAATSAVLKAIDHLTVDRTTVAITHDAHLALDADRVLWIENGNIELDGTPAELMTEHSGRFAAWVKTQRNATEVS